MSRWLALLLTMAAAVGMLVAPASANNDPHRSYVPGGPVDLPASMCGFPVHLDLASNAYARITALPDGSTMYKFTGSLFVTATNANTETSIVVNVSGPATQIVSADGATFKMDAMGRGMWYAPNLTQFGFPSNIVVTSGLFQATFDAAGVAGVTRMPHVVLDVCAALAP